MAVSSYAKQIEALSKIGKAITSYTYLDEVLDFIMVTTAEVMDSNICSLMLLNEKKELVIRATQAVSKNYRKKPSMKMGEGIAGIVAKENKPILVDDVRKDGRYLNHEVAVKEGLCSLLSVPLNVKGKVIGVINCYTSELHNFRKDEIELLVTIANQAAIVIENAQLVLKTREIQEELETRKVVERAKGILMRMQNMTEEEAFCRIQKKSMNLGKPMKEIADAIILTAELGVKD